MKFKKLNAKVTYYQNKAVKLGCGCGCPCFQRNQFVYYGANVVVLAVAK